MRRKIVVGIVAMVFATLSACGVENNGDAVSLEPYSLEAGHASNAADNRGSNSTTGAEEEPGSVADANGGSGNPSATGETPSTGKESDTSENGFGDAGNMSVVPSSDAGAAPGRDILLSGVSADVRTAAESLSDTDREIYLRAVNENDGDSNTYSLIYVDGDDIPEMVLHDNYFGEYSIYTVKDNTLFCMADSIGTVELTYFERCGVIAGFSRWNGGGDEGGYGSSYIQVSKDRTISNDDQAVLSYSYNATYNEKGEYTGTGVTDYFYMGQEIEEAVYLEKMKSLGIAEGEDRLCMENSCSREEIIALLN